MTFNKKNLARLAAIQAMYQFEIANQEPSFEDLKNSLNTYYNNEILAEEFASEKEIFDKYKIKFQQSYFSELLQYTLDNFKEFDESLANYGSNNSKKLSSDLSLVSILRVGMCEMKYFPETPAKVIINEYTNLANEFVKEHDIGFVNSALDHFAKIMRPQA